MSTTAPPPPPLVSPRDSIVPGGAPPASPARGALLALPLIYLNMGAEMVYVLDQRLRAQAVAAPRALQVLREVLAAMLDEKTLASLFQPREAVLPRAVRLLFDHLAHASIMRLNKQSMDRLFDLMVMGFKAQVVGPACACPSWLLQASLNHVAGLKEALRLAQEAAARAEGNNSNSGSSNNNTNAEAAVFAALDEAAARFTRVYGAFSLGEWASARRTLLKYLQDRRVKVSLLLASGAQHGDGSLVVDPYGARAATSGGGAAAAPAAAAAGVTLVLPPYVQAPGTVTTYTYPASSSSSSSASAGGVASTAPVKGWKPLGPADAAALNAAAGQPPARAPFEPSPAAARVGTVAASLGVAKSAALGLGVNVYSAVAEQRRDDRAALAALAAAGGSGGAAGAAGAGAGLTSALLQDFLAAPSASAGGGQEEAEADPRAAAAAAAVLASLLGGGSASANGAKAQGELLALSLFDEDDEGSGVAGFSTVAALTGRGAASGAAGGVSGHAGEQLLAAKAGAAGSSSAATVAAFGLTRAEAASLARAAGAASGGKEAEAKEDGKEGEEEEEEDGDDLLALMDSAVKGGRR